MTNTIPTIPSAGYIVRDNEAIWGAGATAGEAWNAMLNEHRCVYTHFINDTEYRSAEQRAKDDAITQDDMSDWVLASNSHVEPASAALIANVKAGGVICAWKILDGVSCTAAEMQAVIDA